MPGLLASKSDEKITTSEIAMEDEITISCSDKLVIPDEWISIIQIPDDAEYKGDGRVSCISASKAQNYNIKPYDPNNPNARGIKVVIVDDPEWIRCTTCSMEDDHYAKDCPNVKADGTIDYSYKEKLVCPICDKKGDHTGWGCPKLLPGPCEKCGAEPDDPKHDDNMCTVKYALAQENAGPRKLPELCPGLKRIMAMEEKRSEAAVLHDHIRNVSGTENNGEASCSTLPQAML